MCVHTDLFPEDALLDTCIWVPAKHRPMYISRSCSSTCPGCPQALSSTLHMAARSRGLLVILLVPGCLSLWTPPHLGISHLDEWKWLLLTATVITGFPQAKKALCRHGHPRRHGGDHSPFFSPSWVPYWELGVHAGNTEKVWGPRWPGESYVWWMKGLSSLWP